MSMREPDLNIASHFSLWVHGRQFPDAQDYWDGNWLNVLARVKTDGAKVEASGAIVRNSEILGFCKELEALDSNVSGSAHLKCIEPDLDIVLKADTLGHIAITIMITPDQLNQSHTFKFDFDQTFLKPLIKACKDILSRYPIREPLG